FTDQAERNACDIESPEALPRRAIKRQLNGFACEPFVAITTRDCPGQSRSHRSIGVPDFVCGSEPAPAFDGFSTIARDPFSERVRSCQFVARIKSHRLFQ